MKVYTEFGVFDATKISVWIGVKSSHDVNSQSVEVLLNEAKKVGRINFNPNTGCLNSIEMAPLAWQYYVDRLEYNGEEIFNRLSPSL